MEENRLPVCAQLPEDTYELRELVQNAKDYALMHGFGIRPKNEYFSTDSLVFMPFTLLPSTFPKEEFVRAVNIQPILNKLMHRVAHSYHFLEENLKTTIEVDEFTRKLFSIYEEICKEGIRQSVSLGLLRSDYMLDTVAESPAIIKQVEVNAIATSLAGSSSVLDCCHRFVLNRLGYDEEFLSHVLPKNNALSGLCNGLVSAWKYYGNERAAILFVVEDVTYNICDQRWHEYEIYNQAPKVRILRATLTDISQRGYLDEDYRLFLSGTEVAVVYFRTGYSPEQYHSEVEWEVRLMMERSKAVKCPSIQYHLAGTKKVQQVLSDPRVLKKFLNSDEEVDSVKGIFTGIYSLDVGEEGDKAVERALQNPSQFVLKPQREGGGNNVYGEDVRMELLRTKDTVERSMYILMNRIRPPVQRNYILRPEVMEGNSFAQTVDIVSELGIYGVILGDNEDIYINEQVGHVLRSKEHSENEGGVSLGAGALDSPYLI